MAVFFMIGIMASANTARADDLAKASQNPVADLISVPFENNATFNNGPDEDAYVNILNIKPVVPVHLNENWNLINRAIVPVIYQEELLPGQGSQTGIGDITYQGFISPAKPGKLIWGVGPTLVIPSGSSNRMSSNKFSLGPSVVLLTMPGNWVIGALAQNVWSVAGEEDSKSVNSFLFQYFINYNMKDGWYMSTTPTITANWRAGSDDTWTVPFGGGIGRVFKIGKQPVNMRIQGLYNVERPTGAPDWTIQAQVTLLFPKKK